MPSISIGLPVYNGELYLRVALDSIVAQTFSDFELIISDNASTDGTENICLEYAARDQRIRYHRNDANIGAAENFRRVFQLSSAKYFKWAGVDDYLAPIFLEKCKKILDEHPEVVLSCTKVNIIDGAGKILRRYDDQQGLLQSLPRDRFRQWLQQDSWCNAVYGLIRSDELRKTRLMGNFGGSDIVFVAELSLYGQFNEIPEYLFFRRIHEQAFSYECSIEKQREFYTPKKKSGAGLVLRTWRHLYEHTRSISRAPVNVVEKIHLLFHILRLAWWRKAQLISEVTSVLRKSAIR